MEIETRETTMHYKETKYGFEYGSARIYRATSDEKVGWSVIMVETPKTVIQIYTTKTGKVRVYDYKKGKEMFVRGTP